MASKLENVSKTANHYAKLIVERAQLELGTRRKHTSGSGRVYSGRKVGTGELRKNLDYIITEQKGIFSVKFGAKGLAEKYAYYVHEGRRRGKQPPVEELIAWMRKKNIRPRNKDGAFIEATKSRMRGMAYTIARSIGKYGIPAFPYYRMALKKYDTQLTDALLKAIELDVEIEFKDL